MQVYRAKRATKLDMTKFHTDEYIDLLEKVTPETCEALTGGGGRCERILLHSYAAFRYPKVCVKEPECADDQA